MMMSWPNLYSLPNSNLQTEILHVAVIYLKMITVDLVGFSLKKSVQLLFLKYLTLSWRRGWDLNATVSGSKQALILKFLGLISNQKRKPSTRVYV